MGRKLVLHGTKLTAQTPALPEIDGILPATGALMLIDPTHPYRSWDAGTPAHLSLVPNLAEEQAMAATGLTAQNVSAMLAIGSKMNTGTSGHGRVERSVKGGLHIAHSRKAVTTTAELDGQIARLDFVESRADSTAFQGWINTNKAHAFYWAAWGRWTRPLGFMNTAGGMQISRVAGGNQFGTIYTRSNNTGEVIYPSTADRTGWEANNLSPAAEGAFFGDGAVSTGAAATTIAFTPWLVARSTLGVASASAAFSGVLYGYYLEDLTISGRSYLEVHELVKEKYTRDVLSERGRYYGDTTPTDPASLDA